MRIALLAPSGAGKTSYLTGLYGTLINDLSNSRYGIDFSVTNPALRYSLEQRYNALLEQHDFGDGSKEMTIYPFSLSAKDSEGVTQKLPVEIVDFPGGFLHRATEANSQEVERVVQALSECDGFIVLLDGDAVINGIERHDPRILQNAIKASAIQDVLLKALERRRANTATGLQDPDKYPFGTGRTPVVFALTKGDLVENWLARNPDTQLEKFEAGIRRQFALRADDLTLAFQTTEERSSNFIIRSQFGQTVVGPIEESYREYLPIPGYLPTPGVRSEADVRQQFSAYADGLQTFFLKKEGPIASFIRSQFGRVITDPNVCSLRTSVTVYNESEGMLTLQNVAALFQFTMFASLLNAAKEYKARKEAWLQNSYVTRAAYDAKLALYDAAKAKNSLSYYENGVRGCRGCDLDKASQTHNQGVDAWKKTTENLRIAELFMERIVPPELTNRLCQLNQRTSNLYHQGLDLQSVAYSAWWKKKCHDGQQLLKQKPL